MRPTIGVTTSARGGTMSWLFNCLAVWRAGGRAIRITSRRELGNVQLDGLIIGGGDDIGAELYGGRIEFNVRVDQKRDALEQKMLSEALEQKIPVLGICRGSQMINIHRSGNLHTDIYEVYKDAPKLWTVLPKKQVTLEKPSKLFGILRHRRFRINCLHHQSIDNLGEGLQVVAMDDFGIIQAIESTQHPFLIGVQWHPEYVPQSSSHQRLFRALIKYAREKLV